MNPENRQPDKNGNDPNKLKFDFNKNRFALFFLISLIIMFVLLFMMNSGGGEMEISYSNFLNYLKEGQVDAVKILDNSEIRGTMKSSDGQSVVFVTTIPYYHDNLIPMLEEHDVNISGGTKGLSAGRVFLELIPWLLFLLFFWFMFRQVQGGGNKAFSFGKSKAKQYLEQDSRITFNDVAGQSEAKFELEEVVDFLKNPTKFTKIGAKIPKGVLLVGMPGTGKTLLAKAVAGEAGVAFFHMSGSDFVEMFVGVGASRVRDLFEQGRRHAPCIIFIDELDAVGRTRGAGYGGGHDEREQTLNQMLVEMDGFDTKDGVIILAATNRPDVLDPALLRPGRFDRQVVVDMPDVKEREDILAIHCQKIQLADDVDLNRIARATPGTSGADLANMVNEAALFAARNNRETVHMLDFEEARDKTLLGVARKSRVITLEDKRATAYHEAGHALLHYYLKHADPLHKVTVVPHGRALGLALSLPERDTYSRTKGWLMDRIKIAMGGYVAEELIYGETTTGTQNDIKQATSIARRMVTEWGMSEELGFVALGQEDEPIFIGKEIAQHKDYSEDTATRIDVSVRTLLKNALDETRTILTEHKDQLDTLAKNLVKEETLDDAEIRMLLGFPPRESITSLKIETSEPEDSESDPESEDEEK
ncbi:ATP-dependent zinc metalloprotease FtsH [Sediminispirochaeta smaragdinae]|uniref:ATP-dependent zinc metalloprotease FtsH n=1 Tax=Sediminispirochaeta smaragdinae (strain DSM 11293 / JCM 15392 / SEBR 4228) TaxID=573413 RepID=E1R6C5_SEDSS|nr:ATP-dependent zinc metalloprotease FtsH [Sediminispirochaeta smaragdinae]ADK80943.1 ATP-dependent metalloprotease FtsH [Sediminispirochaeta smaragdinae DSM 11293]